MGFLVEAVLAVIGFLLTDWPPAAKPYEPQAGRGIGRGLRKLM